MPSPPAKKPKGSPAQKGRLAAKKITTQKARAPRIAKIEPGLDILPNYSVTAYGRKARAFLRPLRTQLKKMTKSGLIDGQKAAYRRAILDTLWDETASARSFADFTKLLLVQHKFSADAKKRVRRAQNYPYKKPGARNVMLGFYRREAIDAMTATVFMRDLLQQMEKALEDNDPIIEEADKPPFQPKALVPLTRTRT